MAGLIAEFRAALTRDSRDALHVEARAVAVADRGDRDERRLLVDRGVERLERNLGALRRDVDHLCAARFLCVVGVVPSALSRVMLRDTGDRLELGRHLDAQSRTVLGAELKKRLRY